MGEPMPEEWRPVAGYEGFYEVSDLGRVRSLVRMTRQGRRGGKVLKPQMHPDGHLQLSLSREGIVTHKWVHVLVAEAFICLRPPGLEVRHLDGNPANNLPGNLEWSDHPTNVRDMLRHGTHYETNKTHCKHGHEFTPANTYVWPGNGMRACRQCKRNRANARNARNRAAQA